jgi:hypothetical protein
VFGPAAAAAANAVGSSLRASSAFEDVKLD